MFYMNMRAFNEGEQAEAYKKRKEEEKARKEKESDDRAERRYKAEKVMMVDTVNGLVQDVK